MGNITNPRLHLFVTQLNTGHQPTPTNFYLRCSNQMNQWNLSHERRRPSPKAKPGAVSLF